MSRDQKEICLFCRWFREWEDAIKAGYDFGECRVNPPVADREMNGKWPTVRAEDWCGKFQEHRDDHEDRATRLLGTKYMQQENG